MLKLGTQRLLIIISGLTMLGQSVSAMPPTPRPPEPVILSTAVDEEALCRCCATASPRPS
jgi:hypothetical protein